MAIKINGMLHGYTLKERIHELQQTFDMKQRNYDQRQTNDRELLHAQEQVSCSAAAATLAVRGIYSEGL